MPKYYFCDTEMLISLNEEAIKNPHATRAIDEKTYPLLDPDGKHVLDQYLLGRYANTGFTRFNVLVKMKDKEKPVMVTLELTPDQIDTLIPYTERMDELLESAKICSSCGRLSPHLEEDYLCIVCRSNLKESNER